MKKITSIIMICFATLLHGQTFLTVKTIKYENNRISAYNVQGYVVYQVDCKDFVWQRNPDLTIKIWDDIHSYTVNSTSLTSPAWAVVEDSLRAWQTNCSIISTSSTNAQTNLDTSQVDTSLVLPLFLSEINNTLKLINSKGYDSSQVDTSLIVPLYLNEIKEILFAINAKTTDSTHQDTSFIVPVYLEQIKDLLAIINNKTQDTTQTDTSIIVPSYLSQIAQTLDLINSRAYDSSQVDTSLVLPTLISNFSVNNNDTLSAILQTIKTIDVADTSNLWMINEVYNQLGLINARAYDTSQVDTSLLTSTIIDRLDTLIALQIRDTITKSTDTLKALVFKPFTKNVTSTKDTLYNCKGLSFKANSTATGNLIVYYADGESDTYNVATEDLPYWDNSTFISFVGYDATGITGTLRINSVGCSQTETEICAKLKPIIECATNTPIVTCAGWASGSGIWNSISGCWNTGQ